MSNRLSSIAWFVGTLLAVIVVVGGVQTSSARFSGSTSNRSNLWQAGSLSLEIDAGGEGSNIDLFLNGEGLYPGLLLENCIPFSVTTTLDQVHVRLHGEPDGDGALDLSQYFNVKIELGSAEEGCSSFTVGQNVFSGTLAELTTDHRSFERGVALDAPLSEVSYLRFTGSVIDTNDAQNLEAEYTIHIEARP